MLTDGNQKPGSVKMGYFALKFLFCNIYHKEWAKEYLPSPKIAKTLPLVLSKDEVADAHAAIGNFKHRCLIMFIYSKPQYYLFEGANGKGTHLGVSAVREICRIARYKTPHIKKRYTPHTFRHSFATHHLEQGTNLLVIQRLMGHTDLTHTLKYLHVQQISPEQCVNPLDNLNDLEGLCKNK